MRANVIRIGNSRGLRIPRALFEQCGIRDAVERSVEGGRLVAQAAPRAREGWAEAAREMAARGEDGLLDPLTPTIFDGTEWDW